MGSGERREVGGCDGRAIRKLRILVSFIEMLVVLGIISILLLLFVPNLSKQKQKIQEDGNAVVVKVVESQMDIYELEHGVRPTAEELENLEMITKEQLKEYNNAPKE